MSVVSGQTKLSVISVHFKPIQEARVSGVQP